MLSTGKRADNLRIDWRWGDSDLALLERYATELVALAPDLLLAGSSSTAVGALQRRTSTIPVVFANVTDPVGQGFVGSLAHPGGNITGFSNYDPLMVSKWLGMLTQLTPSVAHVAALYNPATTPYASLLLRAIEQAAPSLAVTVRAAPVKDDVGDRSGDSRRSRAKIAAACWSCRTFSTINIATPSSLSRSKHRRARGLCVSVFSLWLAG